MKKILRRIEDFVANLFSPIKGDADYRERLNRQVDKHRGSIRFVGFLFGFLVGILITATITYV